MASVSIDEIKKSYGEMEVLHGISTEIEDGEFVILVGPSGCGKSTLLRMIAGLESVSAGKIMVDGRVVNNVEPKNRDIAMVFQSYALYPHMTVAQNMGFSLKLNRRPAAEIREKVEAASNILGLDAYLERYPRELSGGQRQRVAMGRAIVREPKVFLFDEPLSNLDAKLRVQMRAEIKQLHRTLGTTIIYVTHDQVEAMTMADKIVVMREGYVEQVGSPLELYDQPVNTFVAGFIGSPGMNFMEGQAKSGKDSAYILTDGTRLPLGEQGKVPHDRQTIYGIRPEHIQISQDGVPAQVTLVEPLGSEVQLALKIGDQQVIARIRGKRTFDLGQTVHIQPELQEIRLFDKKTGLRID